MDEQLEYPLGPFYYAAVPESSDVHILSEDQKILALVMSQQSGHENAPADRTALQAVALFTLAPRMRDALEILLEREHEPMHPLIADSVRRLLDEIEEGYGRSIGHQRDIHRERIERQRRMNLNSDRARFAAPIRSPLEPPSTKMPLTGETSLNSRA